MAARFRVALHGFSEFERNALAFCLKHAGERVPGYAQAPSIGESDFIVADASHEALEGSLTRGERLRDTLFVGEKVPAGAVAHLPRPLDPERILRALDRMVLQRIAPRRPAAADAAPDVELPMRAPEPDFPVLDTRDIVEDTTPAAFQHEPLDIRFSDVDAAAERAARRAAAPAPDTAAAPLADPLAPPPAPARPARPAPPMPSAERAAMTEEERHAAKAAARRKSRAARLAQARQAGTLLEEVLLLDAASEPLALEFLLEAFGFRVVRAHDVAAAALALASRPLAAAFIDIDVEDDDGVDGMTLCHMIKQRLLEVAGEVPPVILMSRRRVAAERVQAKLAGCDAFLTPPIRRGDAARALESCDVALPADERRSVR